MSVTQSTDFDLGALYTALDAQRLARNLTWAQVMAEISNRHERPVRPIGASTVRGLREKTVAEGDGVLQMLRWLNRTPESFVPGREAATADAPQLPDVAPHQTLRFDTAKLHAALDTQRIDGGITWQQVAVEIGGTRAAVLTHLRKGGRTAFPVVMRFTRWLGRPAADFTRGSDW